MSKEYYKSKIADKREDIVSLRSKILRIKDEKRRMESLANSIKKTTSKSSKESYRKQKYPTLLTC